MIDLTHSMRIIQVRFPLVSESDAHYRGQFCICLQLCYKRLKSIFLKLVPSVGLEQIYGIRAHCYNLEQYGKILFVNVSRISGEIVDKFGKVYRVKLDYSCLVHIFHY